MYTGMSSESDTSYLTTNYEYDSWLRPVRTIDSTGYNSGTITYDLNGNVLTSTDANGNVTTNTYDALNRVLTANTVNPNDSSKNVSKSYQYDKMGRTVRTTVNDKSTTYLYDDLGRVYQEEGYNSFKGYKYAGISQYPIYECSGIFHKIIYYEKNYEYDDEMRVSSVQENENDIVSYTYDANGNKKSETLGNGVISTYTYNKANRITKIENKKGNSNISVYEYSYYLDGSDACKVRNENGIIETTEYEYDGLKRLTEESVASQNNTTNTYSYEYDDYGNRSKMTATGSENYVTEYSYNNAQGKYTALLQKETKTVEDDNALKLQNNVKQTVYTYDANGNQITKTADGKTETNTYDGLNQLIGFTDGETTASYTYGISGLRDSKTVNGVTTTHIWSGSQIVVDYTAHYTSTVYIRGTSLAAAFDWDEGSKGDCRFYIQNAHGDVVNLTNTDGEVTKKYTYDAFGVEKDIVDSDTNAFRYCGEYYDAETGTIYLRARYYNPSTGRFISRDSFAGRSADPLSLNLYTYCANNPVRYTDPSGHIITEIVLGAVIVGGLLALTSCDSKTVGKAPVQTSTSNPDYAGTTTQVATSSRATSQTTRTTTTTTTTSVANSKKYTNLTKEQKVFISTIAGEGMWTAKGKPVSTVARQSIANVIVNRVGSREWKDYTTVSEICANTGFDAYDDNNYWSCMEYLDNRDYSNDYYEQVISEVMPIYNREVNDITNGAQLYYTPATMVPEGSTPNWDFDALEEVTIDGVDPYYEARFYKYK